MATGIITTGNGNLLLKQSGKIPVTIRQFLLQCKKKTKTPRFDSPWFGRMVLLPLFIPQW